MDVVISFAPISEQSLRDAFSRHEVNATLHAMAQSLAGATDPELASLRLAELYVSLPESERTWIARGATCLAVSGERALLAVAVEIIDRLDLFECLPALSLVVENYPRKYKLPLQYRMCHVIKELRGRIRSMPPEQRVPMEMEQILCRGILEYGNPESQAAHAVRWLADYAEDAQRIENGQALCRAWILEQLSGDNRIGRLAALELCGIFRIRQACPVLARLSRLPEFLPTHTLERLALTAAMRQLEA